MVEPGESLREDAHRAWEAGDTRTALQCCDRLALCGPDGRLEAALLRGRYLHLLGDPRGALSAYEAVASVEHHDAAIDLGRGLALFELVRLPEAEAALRSAVARDPELAEALHVLGLIAELLGTGAETTYYRSARRLQPKVYPAARHRGLRDFEALVEQAVAGLPAALIEGLGCVPVVVLEGPDPRDLMSVEPPVSPRASGMLSPGDEAFGEAGDPPAVLVFKRNLERSSQSDTALLEGITDVLTTELSRHLAA